MSQLLNLLVNHPVRIAVLGVLIVAGAACSKEDEVPPVGTAVPVEAQVLWLQAFSAHSGEGAPKDYKEALRLARLAAKQGEPRAMWLIALMYIKGDGVAKDFDEAQKWYRRAADRGNAPAMLSVGLDSRAAGDYKEARKWYLLAEKLAEKTQPGIAKIAKESLAKLDEDERRAARDRALKSANALEAALMIGISTKENYQHFVDQGGLDFQSSWRGFKATGYGAVFRTSKGHVPAQLVEAGEPATVSGFTVVLYKSFPGHEIASVNNLKSALSPECGTWSSSDQIMGQWMREHMGQSCILIEKGVQVMVGVQPASMLQ